MEKHCKVCDAKIKGKPVIYDDYYFCNTPNVVCRMRFVDAPNKY